MELNLKYRILNGWNFFRILRAGLAMFVIIESFMGSDVLLGFLGGMVLLQVLLNVGCCGADGCDVRYDIRKPNKTESIKFEEITK